MLSDTQGIQIQDAAWFLGFFRKIWLSLWGWSYSSLTSLWGWFLLLLLYCPNSFFFTCLQICWHLSIYDFLCADLSYFLHCIRPIYVFSLIVLVHDDFSLNIMPQYRNRHSSKWEIVGFSIMLCPKHHILILKDFLYWMICICYIYIFKTAFSSLHDKKWHWHIWEVWVWLLKCFWFAFTMICNWGFQANCCVLFFKYFNSLCLPTEIDYLAFG